MHQDESAWSTFRWMILGLVVVLVLIGGGGYVMGLFDGTSCTTETCEPWVALKKYERLKEVAALLTKKRALIRLYEGRLTSLNDAYLNTSRIGWLREDREQYESWASEAAEVVASYNTLVADYNANMAKFNAQYANGSSVPFITDPSLPSSFKPHIVPRTE